MDAAKGAQEFVLMKITEDHFLGEDLVHIEFDEFFQLFNQDALDKFLIIGLLYGVIPMALMIFYILNLKI
jgi:hypothetical protein